MSLSYYFTFSARPETKAEELVAFLKGVETEAKRMGFSPTLVLDASFDTAERREFARRLTAGLRVQGGRLASATLPADASVHRDDLHNGSCRLMPTDGVIPVVTDEHGDAIIVGFFRYPEEVKDVNGSTVAETRLKSRLWELRAIHRRPPIVRGHGVVPQDSNRKRASTCLIYLIPSRSRV